MTRGATFAYDVETAEHYNYFRDYDPAIGRYFESDPIGLRAGLNTFAYVSGQPLLLTDPLGLKSDRGGILDWFRKKFKPDPIGDTIGESFGNNCALFCTELKNNRRDRGDVASDICYRLIPPHILATQAGGGIFLKCREQCLSQAAIICDGRKASCEVTQ